jgi:hypothetical protein
MAMAYGGKHRPMGIVLLKADYTTELTLVPAGSVDRRAIAQPVLEPPLPRWLAAMRMNANAARSRPSLGVDILVAEGSIGPGPAGRDHQRLKVVLAGKADCHRAFVLVVVIHLVTRHRTASDESDKGLVASGPGYQWPPSQACPFSGASMPNKRTR